MIPETRLERTMPSADILDENPTVSTECSNSEISPMTSYNNYILKKDLEREDVQDDCNYRENFLGVPNFEYDNNSLQDIKSKQEITAVSCISLVSMLMFSIFLCYADRIIMPSCIKNISEEFGFNKSDQGFILGLFYGGYIWTQIIGGYISDTSKLGGKGVLFFGVIFWSLCMIFTSFLSYMGIVGFIICRIFLGVGEGVSFPALNSIVGHHIPPKYSSTVISTIIASSFIGGGFAAFVTPPMILSLGWRGPFYVFGLIGVLWSIVWLFLDVKSLSWTNKPSIYEFYDVKEKNDLEVQLQDFKFKKKLSLEIIPKYEAKSDLLGPVPIGVECLSKHEHEKRESSTEYNIENLQEKKSKYQPILNFTKMLILNKSIFAIIVAQYCHGWTQFGFVTWMPIYFTDICKINSAYLGYYTTPPWVLQAFFVIFFGFLADKLVSFPTKPIIVRKLFQSVSMFVGAACQLALIILNDIGLTSASYAIIAISFMFIFNTMSGGGVTVYQFDIAPEFPAVVYAIGNTFGTIAGLFSVSLTGLILNRSEVNLQVIEHKLDDSILIERWKWVLAIYAIHNIIGGLLFVLLADEKQISLNKQKIENNEDTVSQLGIAKDENINEV